MSMGAVTAKKKERQRDRWRVEAKTYDAVEGDALILMPGAPDRQMVDAKVSVDDETYQLMLQGRICCNCFEPQPEPFPEVCHAYKNPETGEPIGCWYPIREKQLIDMQHRQGAGETVHIGSRINKADEMERLREMDEYEQRTGILLPASVKFPNEVIETPKR